MEGAEIQRCQFFLERKSRTCRMLVKSGQKYCGEHAGQERNRVQCPLDPKHTVNGNELEIHLKRCNSRLNTALPYVRRDVNGVGGDSDGDPSFSLAQLSDLELERIIEKVEAAYTKLDIQLENAFLEHQCVAPELESDSYGSNAKRHLKQQSSILAHADRLGLLQIGNKDDVCYVEFGAGRARLSYWLAKAVEKELRGDSNVASSKSTTPNRVSYVLIEQSGQRYKFENKLPDDQSYSQHFQRIRCAIEHVDLRLVDSIRRSKYSVAFCKHLCGSGTDAALRCLVNASGSSASADAISIIAAILAPCCHHRCDWRTFTGQKTLSDLGVTELEFKALASMSSWATCGLVDADGPKAKIDRKSVGKKCKLLLDYARTKYLEETQLFHASLCYYVPDEVTPENVLIIVRTRKRD